MMEFDVQSYEQRSAIKLSTELFICLGTASTTHEGREKTMIFDRVDGFERACDSGCLIS